MEDHGKVVELLLVQNLVIKRDSDSNAQNGNQWKHRIKNLAASGRERGGRFVLKYLWKEICIPDDWLKYAHGN
jgi:hypothetical protein